MSVPYPRLLFSKWQCSETGPLRWQLRFYQTADDVAFWWLAVIRRRHGLRGWCAPIPVWQRGQYQQRLLVPTFPDAFVSERDLEKKLKTFLKIPYLIWKTRLKTRLYLKIQFSMDKINTAEICSHVEMLRFYKWPKVQCDFKRHILVFFLWMLI